LRAVMPPGSLARATNISMDLPSLFFVLAISLSIAFLVAVAPVLVTRKMDLDAALREGWKSGAAPPRMQSRLNILMAKELALSFILLFGAGLFISSHSRLKQVR
jgi:hypothetical protein